MISGKWLRSNKIYFLLSWEDKQIANPNRTRAMHFISSFIYSRFLYWINDTLHWLHPFDTQRQPSDQTKKNTHRNTWFAHLCNELKQWQYLFFILNFPLFLLMVWQCNLEKKKKTKREPLRLHISISVTSVPIPIRAQKCATTDAAIAVSLNHYVVVGCPV